MWCGTHHLLGACVGRHGGEGEDAVINGGGVVQVLQHGAKQLQQLAVVRLEGLRVRVHHFTEEQEAHLRGGRRNPTSLM